MNRFAVIALAAAALFATAGTCVAKAPIPPPAVDPDGCTRRTSSASPGSGGTLVLNVRECQKDELRDIEVRRPGEGKGHDVTLLKLRQNLNEALSGGARFFDLEHDGVPELEVTKSCGAGPNCERDVYKLDSLRKAYRLYFSGGYFELKMLDGKLVESSRSSCCSWESHVYPAAVLDRAIDERDMLMQFEVLADDDGQEAVTHAVCKASVRDGFAGGFKALANIPAALLPLCEAFGKNYSLAQ